MEVRSPLKLWYLRTTRSRRSVNVVLRIDSGGCLPPKINLNWMRIDSILGESIQEDDEKTTYDERLSRMEILPPKYIGDGVLPDAKYPEFWWLIDIQGLRPFLYMRGR
ncbi:hypothetical protein PIB30_063528 [Stylosanthes scabra]|uniref:Uncharacterized protein n=1 Tax=Stylosanthes scabra TaxID=79078 RepID=A0ABU6ZK58_9FABA|nr:hypothetical protein [Stylosanthes scabra]